MNRRFEELARAVPALMTEYSVPGLALGMLIDGQPCTAVFGVTSIENPLDVNDDTLFQIGSTTKTVTAMCLIRLVEQGHVGLDDHVVNHVPELQLADTSVTDAVTIRHLLNHTAGWAGDLFVDTGFGDDAATRYVEAMGDLPQLTPLGALSVYNNAGFVLAGRIIESVTGETYEKAASRLVLEPLGMDQSLFDPVAAMVHRFAVGHNVHPDGRVAIATPWPIPRSMAAAGALASTVTDQLRYAAFHMGDGSLADGTRLVAHEYMIEMQAASAEFVNDRWFGLAWMISDAEGHKIVAHGGSTNGQTSDFWMCPERKIAFTSLTNATTGHLLNNRLSEMAQRLFLDFQPTPVVPRATKDPDVLDEYTGNYFTEPLHEVFEISREGVSLVISMIDRGRRGTVFDDPPDMIPSTMEFYDEDRVIFRAGDLDGTKATFLRNDVGAVTHLRTSRLMIKQPS